MPIIRKPTSYKKKTDELPRSIPVGMQPTYLDVTQLDTADVNKPKPASAPWGITLYLQEGGIDTAPKPLDVNLSPVMQSYTKINNVVIDVSSAVDWSMNDDTDQSDMSGDGKVPGNLGVIAGAMFVASISPDLPVALFSITSARPESYVADSRTLITYQMIGTMNNPSTAALLANLEVKTIKELTYNPDVIGDEALASEDDIAQTQDIFRLQEDLIRGYKARYIHPDSDLLLIPDSDGDIDTYKYFDPNVAKYVSDVFGIHLHDHARDVRTIYNNMFDRDNRYYNPVHTFMHLTDVENSWIRNHLNYTHAIKVVEADTKTPTDADLPLTGDELELFLKNANPDDASNDDIPEIDATIYDGTSIIAMNAIIHHTLDGYNDKTDIQLARTYGDRYPRIVRGVLNGSFDTITIGGINEDLVSDLNIYLIENGVAVWSGVLSKSNYINGIDTLIDYPLGKTYTHDEDHHYYIEVNHPDPYRGTFIFHHLEVAFNNGEVVNTVPGIPVDVGLLSHRTTDNIMVATTWENARTAGSPPPMIVEEITAGEINIVRVTASNISYANPLSLKVEYDNVIYLLSELMVSSYPQGYKATVDYVLPSTIKVEDPKELTVVISSVNDDIGNLIINDVQLGLASDLGPAPETVPLEGTVVINPVELGRIYHVNLSGNEEDVDVPDFRLVGQVPPLCTVELREGTFDTIRMQIDNFDTVNNITLSLQDDDGIVQDFPDIINDVGEGLSSWIDYELNETYIVNPELNPKIVLYSPTATGGNASIKEIEPDMKSVLPSLPASTDLEYPLLPLEISSIKHVSSEGMLQDVDISNIRTDGAPSAMISIVVEQGSFDTLRIKAVNKSLTKPLDINIEYEGNTFNVGMINNLDYPLDYLVTKDYSLDDVYTVYNGNPLTINISGNDIDIGMLKFYSVELGIIDNMGTPADPILAFVTEPICNERNNWFTSSTRLWSHLSNPRHCDEQERELVSSVYADSLKVTKSIVEEISVTDPDSFLAIINDREAPEYKDVSFESFKGKIINPISGNRYVLSESFYKGLAPTSALEAVMKEYLEEGTVNIELLGTLMEDYKNWEHLEKFYYGPILVHLSRVLFNK